MKVSDIKAIVPLAEVHELAEDKMYIIQVPNFTNLSDVNALRRCLSEAPESLTKHISIY